MMKYWNMVFTALLLIGAGIFAGGNQEAITAVLKTNAEVYKPGESVEFRTTIFCPRTIPVLSVGSPVSNGQDPFGVGIRIESAEKALFRFIRTPFWHYRMLKEPLSVKDGKAAYVFTFPQKYDACRLIPIGDDVDEYPIETRDIDKHVKAFERASRSLPWGHYRAWLELDLYTPSEPKEGDRHSIAGLDQRIRVASEPITFVIEEDSSHH